MPINSCTTCTPHLNNTQDQCQIRDIWKTPKKTFSSPSETTRKVVSICMQQFCLEINALLAYYTHCMGPSLSTKNYNSIHSEIYWETCPLSLGKCALSLLSQAMSKYLKLFLNASCTLPSAFSYNIKLTLHLLQP
jgi:hypothetical protein